MSGRIYPNHSHSTFPRALQRTYNKVWAVVLIGALTLRALEARPDLRANPDAVAYFDLFHILAHRYSFANDLVADAQWALILSPTAGDRMAA